MTIKIVECWLDRKANETICSVVDHLVTDAEINSLTLLEIEQVAEILKSQGLSVPVLYTEPTDVCKKFISEHISDYYLLGRDMEDGYIVVMPPWDFKAAEVASL